MTLGRDATSDLVIDNAGVSRTHAILIYVDAQYRIRDAESQNGLTVNGQRVHEAVLSYGDIIGINKFEIELLESGHYPVQVGEQPKAPAVKNVMGTLQMDPATAARMRDEAMAKIAALNGQPAPTHAHSPGVRGNTGASRRPPARAPSVRAAPAPQGSDVVAILKVAGLVLLGLVALGGAALFVLSH